MNSKDVGKNKDTKVDLNELYARIYDATTQDATSSDSHHCRRRRRRPSLLGQLVEAAKEKKKALLSGEISGLPLHWGTEPNRPWHTLTSQYVFHAPLRMDLAQLNTLVRTRHLFKDKGAAACRCFHKVLRLFKAQVLQLFKFKRAVSEERLVYGFLYRVTTKYDDFWTSLEQCMDASQRMCQEVDHAVLNAASSESSLRAALSEPPLHAVSLLDRHALRQDMHDALATACQELEMCLNEEDALVSSLLRDHFNERDEHESILAALHAPGADALVLEKITHAMYHWLGVTGRRDFIHCLSKKLQWVRHSLSEKELAEYHLLLKGVVDPLLTPSTSSPRPPSASTMVSASKKVFRYGVRVAAVRLKKSPSPAASPFFTESSAMLSPCS